MRSSIPIVMLAAAASAASAQSYARDASVAHPVGFASALELSGGELFAGRPGELAFFPSPAGHKGAVHVFARAAGGDWAERAVLQGAASEVGDGFASALGVGPNVVVVGAPKAEENRGAAYVFERTGGGAPWRETARLVLDGGAADDRFGSAIAMAGDAVLIGAPGRTDGAGAVAVFRKNGGGWTQTAVLTGSGIAAGDGFGFAIAADADRAIIGAPGPLPFSSLFGGQQPRGGAAFVFAHDGGEWAEDGRLVLAPAGISALGAAVALAGDDVLVAAPLAGQMAGTVVRYRRSAAGVWAEAGRLTPPGAAPGSGFGLALDAAGTDLFVGAPVGNGTGAVHVFRRDAAGAWSHVQQIASETQFAFFGSAIAVAGDDAVIGGPGADFFEGTGFVYRKDGGNGQWRAAGTVIGEVAAPEPITGGMRECRDGKVAGHDCSEVDLVSYLPVSALGGDRGMIVNDLWGWTDPESGKEYAIVGRADATVFIDVSAAANPVYLGELPLHTGATPNLWRDMKVYRNHVFIVADGAGPHGVQVFDLTRLRNVANPPAQFTEDAHYDRIHSAHNIVMNESTGFAYAVGSSMGGETCGGGLHMIDVREPKTPKFAGCFADPQTGNARTGYSHDAQCIQYAGPDADYRGREICFGSNETMLSIADVTDKQNTKAIARAAYPNVAYLHQGWVSDDHRFLYMNDEGDELSGVVPRTRTLVWDITDLDDPVLVKEYLGETAASDHNLYVRGNYVYESNYVSGLRILDITDPANPKEVGSFDTVPEGENAPGFAGSWSNYPYFRSGNIVVTSMREGVFVVRFRRMERPIS
jgi:choice-of-anchor B domain-containing protein